jgi:hypothetical protein
MFNKTLGIVSSIFKAILVPLGWFLIGMYRTRAKTSEAALKSVRKANEIKNKVLSDSKYRDRIERMFGKK